MSAYWVFVLFTELTDHFHPSRLTEDNMTDEVDGGINDSILPQTFHPLYHLYPFETPQILRYRPAVEKFRAVLRNATSDDVKQAYVTKMREETTIMNNVGDVNLNISTSPSIFNFVDGLPGCIRMSSMAPVPRVESIFGTATGKIYTILNTTLAFYPWLIGANTNRAHVRESAPLL
jgi:hypothetical protein